MFSFTKNDEKCHLISWFYLWAIHYIYNFTFHIIILLLAGAVYLDLPATLLTQNEDESNIFKALPCPSPPLAYPDADLIEQAANLLIRAKKPLVIVGKGKYIDLAIFPTFFFLPFLTLFLYVGAAYGRAENPVRELISSTNVPFLPTPMGKGVVPDTDERCVSSARTLVLQQSDVILLLGARLNWMLHFGRPPRFQSDVKVIQVHWRCISGRIRGVFPCSFLFSFIEIKLN